MKPERLALQSIPGRGHSLGVRGRLLVSFLAIAAFGVLAGLAGTGAFHLVGNRLQEVESRNTSALAILELSRSTEQVLGAIPGLLDMTEQAQRQMVSQALSAKTESLQGELRLLFERGHYVSRLQAIELSLFELSSAIVEMDALVNSRLLASESMAVLQLEAQAANRQITRLLLPWIDIVGMQVPDLIESSYNSVPLHAENLSGQLYSLVNLQRDTQFYGRHIATRFDFLSESSRTTDELRIRILTFQMARELASLLELDKRFDPKLRLSLQAPVTSLQKLSVGPESLPALRTRELELHARGEALLGDMLQSSSILTNTVDQMVSSAKQELSVTIDDVLHLQQQGARLLAVLILLSLLTSCVIFRRYIGGNILKRLKHLSDTMSAIGDGKLSQPVTISGDDEISEMSRVVEQFRLNTQERDELLIQQSQHAIQLEEEVQSRTAELRTANEFKTRFLASASHDIRQPLHALNLFVGQLEGTRYEADHPLLLERIGTSVSCMNELFEGLLDTSRLDAGVLVPEYSSFPVSQILEMLENTFQIMSSARGLQLRIVQSRVWVHSDCTLLKRIMLNLVSNALQCTNHGSVVVECRISRQHLRINVVDTGPGIPADKLETVFEERYQLENCNPGTSGLGLGLTIVKRLADLLDCPLEASSTLGEGSCFSITVPLAAENQEEKQTSMNQPCQLDWLRGACIVVVDDDTLTLEAMQEILDRWGGTVIAGADSNQVLERLSAEHLNPDIIISDVHLADATLGVDAIDSIRKVHGASVRACLVTGDTNPLLQEDASARGLCLMHKPLAAITLGRVIHRLLDDSFAVTPCENGD